MSGLIRKLRLASRPVSNSDVVDDELIVDLAIKEFYQLREQGHEIAPAEYAEQYPATIKSLLLTDLEFEESLSVLQTTGLIHEWSSSGDLSSWQQQNDDDTQWPEVHDEFGEYKLVEQIRGGKFSRVFAASLSPDLAPVAIKFCRRQGTHEARTLANVTHSAIGVVDGVDSVPGTDLIAIRMPLKSRTTLADVLRSVTKSGVIPTSADIAWEEVQWRNKLVAAPPAWAGKSYVAWVHGVMSTLSEALSAAHEQSTAHCDIKPPNVLITEEGTPILIDFNLSLRWDVENVSSNIGGTLPYMAPEQLEAFDAKQRGNIGPRTDIYGLAATIYQLLTGELPFDSPPDGSIHEILTARKVRPTPIRVKNPHVPPAFAAVIMKCLNYHPKDRPRTAADLVARLNQVATSPNNALALRRRVPAPALMVGVALVSVLTFAIAFPRQSQSSLPDLAISTVGEPEQVEPDIIQMMNTGYDAFESGDFEVAEANFSDVLAINPDHYGASLGYARTRFKLGDTLAATSLFNTVPFGSAEFHAVRGLHLALNEKYPLAASSFQIAVDGGLRTREVLTNLGFCLSRTGKHEVAIEVLEQVCRMGGDSSTANLVLAQTYMRYWSRRINGKEVHQFDTDYLMNLIDECPLTAPKAFTASVLSSVVASRADRKGDTESRDYWAEKSQREFDDGCSVGLDPRYARGIKYASSKSPTGGSVNSDATGPDQHLLFFLLDPLSGSRIARWTEGLPPQKG